MVRIISRGAIGAILLLTSFIAHAIVVPIGNDDCIDGKQWPISIIEASEKHRRVYGQTSSDGGLSLYFVGQTHDLNRFLETIASTPDAFLRATFFEGKGSVYTRRDKEGNQMEPVSYNWAVNAVSQNDRPAFLREGEPNARWLITVNIRIGEDVRLEDLGLPLAYKADIGGGIAEFVKFHQSRRSDPGAQADQPTREPKAVFVE